MRGSQMMYRCPLRVAANVQGLIKTVSSLAANGKRLCVSAVIEKLMLKI